MIIISVSLGKLFLLGCVRGKPKVDLLFSRKMMFIFRSISAIMYKNSIGLEQPSADPA